MLVNEYTIPPGSNSYKNVIKAINAVQYAIKYMYISKNMDI